MHGAKEYRFFFGRCGLSLRDVCVCACLCVCVYVCLCQCVFVFCLCLCVLLLGDGTLFVDLPLEGDGLRCFEGGGGPIARVKHS